MDLNTSFATNLRRARRAANISQSELAHACHINASYLCQLESGKRNPTLSLVQRAARALRISPLHLLQDASISATKNIPFDSESISFDDYPIIFCTKDGLHLLHPGHEYYEHAKGALRQGAHEYKANCQRDCPEQSWPTLERAKPLRERGC